MGRVDVRSREKNSRFIRGGGGVGSEGRTKTGIEEERAAANSNLLVKGAPVHPASSMRGSSASK